MKCDPESTKTDIYQKHEFESWSVADSDISGRKINPSVFGSVFTSKAYITCIY